MMNLPVVYLCQARRCNGSAGRTGARPASARASTRRTRGRATPLAAASQSTTIPPANSASQLRGRMALPTTREEEGNRWC
jgi:hypothetical protein